jgi:hypothetical protein
VVSVARQFVYVLLVVVMVALCGLCGKAVCICVPGCCDGSTLLTLNIGIFGS